MRNHTEPIIIHDEPDLQNGAIQIEWIEMRAAKAYFERGVHLERLQSNPFDWSGEPHRHLSRALGYRKPKPKKLPYKLMKAVKTAAKNSRPLYPDRSLAASAIG